MLEGVFAAVLTPMREDLSVDRAAFAAALPAAARRRLPRARRSSAPPARRTRCRSPSGSTRWDALVEDGIPADALLPGTGACALPDAVPLAREALALGAPGVLMLPPFYYKGVSDDGLFRFFAELIERVGDDRLRVFLYHIPPMAQVRLHARADRAAARRLPGHRRRHEGQRGRRGADRADVQGVPAADRVRGLRALPARHAALGRRRLHLRDRATSRAAQSRSVYDLWEAGDDARTPSRPR